MGWASLNVYDLISLNRYPGVTRVGSFGNNPDVDVGTTPEDIWTLGGRYPWFLTATNISVSSSDINDTSAGTGARTISISALDASFNPVTILVTLNGTTPVTIATPIYRINSARVSTAGSVRYNVGDISIFDTTGGTVRAVLPATYSATRQACYTVASGFTLLINSIYMGIRSPSGGVGRYASISTWFNSIVNVNTTPITLESTNSAPYRHDVTPPIAVTSGMDFSLLVSNVTDPSTEVTGAWNGILVRV